MKFKVFVLALTASVPLLMYGDELGDELLAATRKGDIAAVKALLDKGADVNAKSPYGSTPLFFAADRGHTEIAKLLLDRGANPNVKDTFYNETALGWAGSKGRIEIVRLLLAKGAEGADMLLVSGVQSNNKDLVQVALDTGKIKQSSLNFGLSMAIKAKKTEMAEMLTKAGAKPPAAATFAIDAATLASYAGKYQGGRGGTEFDFLLAVVDGKLALTAPQKMTFAAVDKTHFRGVEQESVEVEFVLADGKVMGANFGNPGGKLELKKVQ